MSLDLFKEILPSIREKEGDLITRENAGEYIPFIINTALSCHLDTLFQANEMNLLPGIPAWLQYKYLQGTIRKRKRSFKPWPKKEKREDIETCMKFFKLNRTKARQIVKCLTQEQLNDIIQRTTEDQ